MSAKPVGEIKNPDDPRGQFGPFLRHVLNAKFDGDVKRVADAVGISERGVRKWMEGYAGPSFGDLDKVAEAIGYRDWIDMAIAIRAFHRKHSK